MGVKAWRENWRRQVREAAEQLDLPQSALTGMPRLELDGGEVEIEGHQGILEYTDTQICVGVKGGMIRVIGAELTLTAMNRQALRFSGVIASIEMLN